VTRLAPVADRGELRLRFYVPLDGVPKPPLVTVSFNGEVVERFIGRTAEVEKKWIVKSRRGQPNELTIETDQLVNPARAGLADDSRDLGLQLQALTWRAAP
jgi:hypothetical protein